MSSPGEAFIGVSAVGLGVLLVYAAYKNAPVLGPNGLLTSVFTSGKLNAAKTTSSGTSGTTPPVVPFIPNAPGLHAPTPTHTFTV